MTIYGAGWENCEWITRPNVFYGGKISAEAVLEKMQDAKIVLNTMTWFKDGTHERIFNGMLQGAVTVSDSSVYMKEEFCGSPSCGEKQDMVLFELDELEQLPAYVNELLQDMTKAQKIADNRYAKAKNLHTWKVRADELEEGLFQ